MTDTTGGDAELAGARLSARSTALVVVDMQEYFCRPGSNFQNFAAVFDPEGTDWYANRVTNLVIPTIDDLIDRARAKGVPVVYTRFGSHDPQGSDMPLWARKHNEMTRDLVGAPSYPPFDDPTCQVVAELQPGPGERVVSKVTSGPAVGTDLIDDFRSQGVSTVVVTGVATNVCVMGMARELADADFEALVVEDACATIGQATQDAALASLATTFASIVSSADVSFDAGAEPAG